MLIEVDPKTTDRDEAWALFRDAPMPTFTIMATVDITNLLALKAKGYKLHMLMCYALGKAARATPQMEIVHFRDRLYKASLDELAVCTTVEDAGGRVRLCDVPFSDDLDEFSGRYLELTKRCHEECVSIFDDHVPKVSVSMLRHPVDGVVNMYSPMFHGPFVAWGTYREEGGRFLLKVSLQIDHIEMDGSHVCAFIERIGDAIDGMRP